MEIKKRLKSGINVYRGVHPRGRASDPGDFGRGIYYSTSKSIAECYGEVKRFKLKFANPLILDEKRAYRLGAGIFNTIGNNPHVEESRRKKNCERMARYLLGKGYDGLVSMDSNHLKQKWTVLEIVDYKVVRR